MEAPACAGAGANGMIGSRLMKSEDTHRYGVIPAAC